uniref:Putative ribonuclease H-like domain-containing protein n=1 Tax=Tanacetum cinerariifolium TaxID=118510 RepID=A0A6L2J423_TANCI|nr:putative ribonuclease H-like domain-containing protein [Tanacetum cinerariifolium]
MITLVLLVGKASNIASCKTKPLSSVNQPLHRLHMDLFGPTFVKSLDKKIYCLVVTDDYSRFTWVFFLATKDETSPILKTFITGLENQFSLKVKVIRSDNGTEFKNNDLNQFCGMKGIKREFSVPRNPQQNGIAERKNRTIIEAARTILADSLLPIPFWAEAVNTACYVQNRVLVTKPHNKTPYELLHGRTPSSGPTWLFDIDTLTKTMNYQPVTASNQSNPNAGVQEQFDAEKAREENTAFDEKEPEFEGRKRESKVNVSLSISAQSKKHDDKTKKEAKGKSPIESLIRYRNLSVEFEDFSDNIINEDNAVGILVPAVGQFSSNSTNTFSVAGPSNVAAKLEDITYSDDEEDVGAEANFNNLETSITVSLIPTTRVHKDHPMTQIIGDLSSATQTMIMTRVAKDQGGLSHINNDDFHTCMFACFLLQEEPKRVHQALKDLSWIEAMQEELLQFKMQKVWVLVDLPYGKRAIGTKWAFRNKKDERDIVVRNKARLVTEGHTQDEGIDYEEVFAPVANIKAIRLFLAYASFMGFMVYQMDVKSAFLYGTIEEEVYVCQPLGFKDPGHLDKVYKVVKVLSGLHQAPRAWYETLANYLLENGFQKGMIDQTLLIKRQKGDILSVQIYVDDIIFGLTNKDLCKAFEKLMKDKFQMSSIRELTFFLGLQVKQKEYRIFISQDKYVAEILRNFGLKDGKSASTPIDTKKPLLKDPDGKDVDVHTYRSMIGLLMYLTSSRPDIMFAVYACDCFQVTPKALHLHAVKKIFRYLKGKPHLGLWYLKDSPFNLVSYSDSDYAGASLDRKSTIRECQFLGCRLIYWQCKKQRVVATSSTEAVYVAAASCYAQFLWIQNQLLDYGHILLDYIFLGFGLTMQVALSGMESLKTMLHVTNILRVNTPRCDEERLELMELTVFCYQVLKKLELELVLLTYKFLLLGLFTAVSLNVYAVSSIKYALTVNTNIYVSCIKQFWTTVAVKKVNDVTRLQALVDKMKVVVTEAAIRDVLRLDDAEGVECLPNEEIFTELARMGYEKPFTKLTFYKAFLSSQWKFLIHTILQCMSAKRTSWNEFSSSMASTVICLSTGRKFNFSKYIFNSLVRNVDSPTKFYMYPRFLQLMIRAQVGDLSSHSTKYTSPALTQKVFANMRRVGKGFFRVDTPLFEGMLVVKEVDGGDADEVHVKDVNVAGVTEGAASVADDEVNVVVDEPSTPSPTPPTPPPQPSQDQHSTSQPNGQMYKPNKKRGIIANIDADEDVVLEDAKDVADVEESTADLGRQAESQAKIYKIDLEHAKKVLSMQEEESKPAKLQEIVDVVPTAKIITEVVTTAITTITTADASILAATIDAAPTLTTTPSKRRKGVVIRDPEETTTTSTIIHSEAKSKDKGKGISVEEPKPLKKQAQIKQDERYARELEEELNKNIDWDEVIDHVHKKEKEDNDVKRYQALKRKPQTEAQARKNMMIYLKNVVGFKMDHFKRMSYDDIRPIFKQKFNSNVAFLLKIKEQIDEEESRALKRLSESQEDKALKKQKLDEEVEELKRHLQIVPNDEDDVYTEATPLALKVPVVDYKIYNENNKPYYKIKRADGSHQLYLSFLSLLRNFDREDLEALWRLIKE